MSVFKRDGISAFIYMCDVSKNFEYQGKKIKIGQKKKRNHSDLFEKSSFSGVRAS